MRDRQPTQPGRVKLTPENGTAPFYAIMEMADEPTEIGTPPTKANLLQDETEHALFGNIADRTVNDAFANIAKELSVLRLKADDVAALSVTLKSTQGNPLANVQILGMFDEDGNTCATNASGVASGYVAEGNVILSVSNYADIVDYSETFVAEAGKSYTRAMTVTTRNFLKLTTSKNIKVSGNVSRVDVTAVGGGGGGGNNHTWSSSSGRQTIDTGGGGGGGYCTVKESVAFTPNTPYSATVGAGGAVGTNGGSSSFLGVTASGGSAGSYGTSGGGAGNGRGGHGVDFDETDGDTHAMGGNGVAGSVAGYSSFTETVIYGGGGGAGSGGHFTAGGSGAGYGGNGAAVQNRTDYPGTAGTDGFGGGGGGSGGVVYSNDFELCSGTKGGSGCIAIRMHLKVA